MSEPLTTKLINGFTVLAKKDKDGEIWPLQFANRTQAQKACDKNPGFQVRQFRGRPFYAMLLEETNYEE